MCWMASWLNTGEIKLTVDLLVTKWLTRGQSDSNTLDNLFYVSTLVGEMEKSQFQLQLSIYTRH